MHLPGTRRLGLGLATAFMLIGSMVYASQLQYVDAVEVVLDGRAVAVAARAEDVEAAVERLQAEARAAAGREVIQTRALQLQPVRVARDRPLADTEQLVSALRGRLRFAVAGVAIRVDGRDAVVVASRDAARRVLQRILDGVRDTIEEAAQAEGARVELRELRFVERVELAEVAVDPARIRDVEAATAVLLRGTDEVREHTVSRGETLWTIARRTGLSVDALVRANPQLSDPNRLQVGQRLNLVVPRPYLTVRSVERQTREVRVPYATQVRYDPDLWPWQRRVERAGVPGRRRVVEDVVRLDGRVTGRVLVSTETLAEPVAEVVVLGSKVAPDVGTGTFRWPMDTGRISSWFGSRGRWDWHEGVDIAAPVGTPVRAADRGVVILAGWYGAYGRTVMVDHGGGRRVTLYGHLSRVAVEVGQQVDKGQVVGYVGCTGRCTGPHLHFEIRIDGRAVDPLRFFR